MTTVTATKPAKQARHVKHDKHEKRHKSPNSPKQSKPAKTKSEPGAPNTSGRRFISYKEAWDQWLHAPSQVDAEKTVLNMTGVMQNPRPGIKASINNVSIKVSKKFIKTRTPLYLHEFAIESDSHVPGSGKTLVIMHGYGAGLGFFYKNFDGLAASLPGWNIYAVDWLGYGLSARPKFHTKTSDLSKTSSTANPSCRAKASSNSTTSVDSSASEGTDSTSSSTAAGAAADEDPVLAVKETEDWFVESLEAWREAKGIDHFTLMGHSLGGYLSSVYAFRHPDRVDKLIMVSPAGVERGHTPELDDRSFFSLFKSPKDQKKIDDLEKKGPPIEQEVTGTEEEQKKEAQRDLLPEQQRAHAAAAEVKSELKNDPNRSNNKMLTYLWNNHISPFSIVRMSGVFGPKAMSAWSNFRFSQFPQEEHEAMHMYCYKTFVASPSGEYGLTRLLAPGALARMPLIDRVNTQLKCKSIWIYGDRDWMNVKAGLELVDNLNSLGNEDQKASFHVVEDAGHHVYLDNHIDFNTLVLEFLGYEV